MAEGFTKGEVPSARDSQEVGRGRAGGPNAKVNVWRTATEGGRGERALDGGPVIETPMNPLPRGAKRRKGVN